MTKRKDVPLLSEEKLLKFSLNDLKKYERLLRDEFKRVKEDTSFDVVEKLRKLRAIRSTVTVCVDREITKVLAQWPQKI